MIVISARIERGNFLRRDRADIKAGGRFDAVESTRFNTFRDEFLTEGDHLAPAGYEGVIFGLDREGDPQGDLVAPALRRDDDEPAPIPALANLEAVNLPICFWRRAEISGGCGDRYMVSERPGLAGKFGRDRT